MELFGDKEKRQQKKVVRQEKIQQKKAEKAAITTRRGKRLGNLLIDYIGGYDPGYSKTHLGGWLECYENEIYFKKRNITIPADQIASFEITGMQQTKSRLSVTRMVTLGVFSLAAPKRTTEKEASIYIGLKDGRQLFFHTTTYSELVIHKKLVNAISHYHSLQTKLDAEQSQTAQHTIDPADEIMKYAKLRDKGVITDAEFQAKKEQLLKF